MTWLALTNCQRKLYMNHPDESAERAEIRLGIERRTAESQRSWSPDLLEIWKESGLNERFVDMVMAKRRLLRAMNLPIETRVEALRLPTGTKLILEIPGTQ